MVLELATWWSCLSGEQIHPAVAPLPVDKAGVVAAFNAMDQNGDQQLTRAEAYQHMPNEATPQEIRAVGDLFNRLDTNDNAGVELFEVGAAVLNGTKDWVGPFTVF